MTLSQYLCLTFDYLSFEGKINYLKEIGEESMSFMFEGHTFEEMVEAIHKQEEYESMLKEMEDAIFDVVSENELLKDEIEELKGELNLARSLNNVQKKYIAIKDEKIEQIEEDLRLLEEAHDNLLVKYDEMVSSILDIVCDSANM